MARKRIKHDVTGPTQHRHLCFRCDGLVCHSDGNCHAVEDHHFAICKVCVAEVSSAES